MMDCRMIGFVAALSLAACEEPAPGAKSPAESAAAASEPVQLEAIPAAFQGVWAATAEDCDKPAKTRLEITADQLHFYESSGPVASVTAANPAEILIVVSLSGEGALSQRSFRYRLIGDGSELFDVRNGLQRRRCPTAGTDSF